MRKLLMVRHAIAHARDVKRWPTDVDRPLTAAGKRKFERVARRCGVVFDRPQALFTSPLKRARQTARILAREAGFPKPVRMRELRPGGGAKQVIAALRATRVKYAAIVGHEPDLGELASELLVGSPTTLRGRFRKGGFVLLEFSNGVASAKAHLCVYAPPRLLLRGKD